MNLLYFDVVCALKMASFPVKMEKPKMKIMGLNILPMIIKMNKVMPENMRKKNVVKQVCAI